MRHLQKVDTQDQYATPIKANLIMDTTYFGRSFDVMVLYDAISNQALSITTVKCEIHALHTPSRTRLKE
ncbi:hypothetical protein [Neisseria iguanae]|nr:hypothetical protein [Neisseria iguanae]